MAERVDASLRIREELIRRREHHAGCAEHDRERTRPRDSCAHRRSSLVARSCRHGNTVERPDAVRTLGQVGQPVERDVEILEELGAPAAPADIEEQRA